MAHLYRRGNIWWWKGQRDGKLHRESTSETSKDKAILVMERRLREIEGKQVPVAPRVLILDIETAPIEAYIWTYFPNFVDPMSQVVLNSKGKPKDWSILTYAAKWLFEGEVFSGVVTPDEAQEREDLSIMQGLWDLFEKADVIIAHNGQQFDIRRCNYRFAINGFGPPSPYQVIDTKILAKKAFGAPSYKQDYLNRAFGLSRKIETKFELWQRCVTGHWSALDDMLTYNIGDIGGLEELFVRIRGWYRGPVNLSMYTDNDKKECGVCLSNELKTLSSSYTTTAGSYESYRCLKCGAIGRSRYTEKSLNQRKQSILVAAR